MTAMPKRYAADEQAVGQSNPADHPFSFLETMIAGKRNLGAHLQFEPKSISVGKNDHGVRGVFAVKDFKKGSEIISVEILNGSLTPFRAYEEAADLLIKIGEHRFNIPASFAIACAMYKRVINDHSKNIDICVTSEDMKTEYFGSPMSSFASVARSELLNSNNRPELDSAVAIERNIRKLDVDIVLFRSILAYVNSRYWKEAGIIPVFDWLNSAYGGDTNCNFVVKNDRFIYIASRDISSGEELLWSYNESNAVSTWFNYGYIDKRRPSFALCEANLSSADFVKLREFMEIHLGSRADSASSIWKVDQKVFQAKILVPGKQSSRSDVYRSISNSLNGFVNARTWFRALVLSRRPDHQQRISHAALQEDDFAFGLATERAVIRAMREALAVGMRRTRSRARRFRRTDVGCGIDVSPYLDLVSEATLTWDNALDCLEVACLAPQPADCLVELNRRFDVGAANLAEFVTLMLRRESDVPTLIGSLCCRYVKARLQSGVA